MFRNYSVNKKDYINPDGRVPLLIYKGPISHRFLIRIQTNCKGDRIPLSSRLLSFVVPLARKKKSGGDCVTKKEGALLPPSLLPSCMKMACPSFLSPDLFLCRLFLSLFLPLGLVLRFTDTAPALEQESRLPRTGQQICYHRKKGKTLRKHTDELRVYVNQYTL